MSKHVILFDIDGTLLSAQQDERERYVCAMQQVTGKTLDVNPSRFAGMVDPQICNALLSGMGFDVDARKDLMPKMLTRMGEVYHEMKKKIPALNGGVLDLLRIISKSPTHVLGIVTGNISAVGEEKLSITGIKPYFSETFYADDYENRERLVKDVVGTCVTKYQLPDNECVMIVGDTPLDIAAARAANATSIGIASGNFSTTQLSRAQARWVFPNLRPSKELLNALNVIK